MGRHNKIPETVRLKQEKFIFPQAWRLDNQTNIKAQADLVAGESALLDLQMAAFFLYPHMMERKRYLLLLL